MNTCGWNIINSLLSIITYIYTTIILLPTIPLSLLFLALFHPLQNCQCLYRLITSCSLLAITLLAGLPWLASWCAQQSPSLSLTLFLPHISSHHVKVSTWTHLRGNRCTKYGHLLSHWSFACVCWFSYTLRPIRPSPRCTGTWMS